MAETKVSATELSTSAIKLAYTELTADANSSGTSDTEATGLATTVTIPVGGRSILLILAGTVQHGTTDSNCIIKLWDGAVGSGTTLASQLITVPAAGGLEAVSIVKSVTPSAGSKTYRVSVATGTGTATLRGTSSPSSGNVGPMTLTILNI